MNRFDRYKNGIGGLRRDVINALVTKYGYKTYLEVGTQRPLQNFDHIAIPQKECVDPMPLEGNMTYLMTSDQAFKKIKLLKKTYDIIFIDGLHAEYQVDKDIANALDVLNEGGTIVMHDCNPPIAEYEKPEWNGTTWRSYAKLRATRPDLTMYVVDVDWGCGVIQRGSQQTYEAPTDPKEWLNYEYLDAHRDELLNIISFEEFSNRLQNS